MYLAALLNPLSRAAAFRRERKNGCSDKRPLSGRLSERRRGVSTSAAQNTQQNDDPYSDVAMAHGAHSAPPCHRRRGVYAWVSSQPRRVDTASALKKRNRPGRVSR